MIDVHKLAGVRVPGVQIDRSQCSALVRAATGIRADQIPSLRAALGVLKAPPMPVLKVLDMPRTSSALCASVMKGV